MTAPAKTRKNRWRVEPAAPRASPSLSRLRPRDERAHQLGGARLRLPEQGAATYLTWSAGCSVRTRSVVRAARSGRRCDARTAVAGPSGTSSFVAADYDTLVDSPIVAGESWPCTSSRTPASRTTSCIVNEGGSWDGARAIGDVERIVAEHERICGATLPYDKLRVHEHDHRGGRRPRAQAIDGADDLALDRWAPASRYLGWLNLVSHEYFHVWNVKRLRPVALGPLRLRGGELLAQPLGVRRLHVVLRRPARAAGRALLGRRVLLQPVRATSARSRRRPGRLAQSVTRVRRYDAWIKQYRPDENSPNSSISYYTKGQVIAALVDARIRDRHGWPEVAGRRDAAGLRAVLPGDRGFTEAQFRAVIVEVGGADLDRRPRPCARHDTATRVPAAARCVWPAVRAGRQPAAARLAGDHDAQRRRTTADQPGPSRHAGRGRRPQRRRRDHRHWRLPRARRPVGPAPRAVPADHDGRRCSSRVAISCCAST